jgi:hypothetical protein
MPASNAFQSDLMGLLFGNSAIANIGNAGGLQPSSAAGSFYIALHTANPGAGGNQATSEAAYTGYARVAVSRAISGSWTQTGSSPTTIANTAAINFPACTGGSETETYFSIGYQSSGATKILASGALTASLAVSNGITPSFAIGQLTCTVD